MDWKFIEETLLSVGYKKLRSEKVKGTGRQEIFTNNYISVTFWVVGRIKTEIRCFIVHKGKFIISSIGNKTYELYNVPLEQIVDMLIKCNTYIKFENRLNELRLDRLP